MIVLKSGGKVIGGKLTNAEKKAMDIEISKQIAVMDRQHEKEIEATILWVLAEEFGFGEKRLRRFYDRFNASLKKLVQRYELAETDEAWLALQKLKDAGIDLDIWERESESSNG